ncbi:hypothetical protein C8F04DRAFT_1074358 [Mycena alexandri]|uniref:DUF6593 domain-containing protein n=1 Tax=Mycena alexandri TaxID=1745969 RepID=A0AAD6X8R8_9AGAR|nr:hypothetical protein C8F04DRAFT_1074358 [Mycena alexandri]
MDSGFPPQPVILTWPDPQAPIPTDIDPPAYEHARMPQHGVNYTLSQGSFNTMLVLPPHTLQDSRPQYFISVLMNCLNPHSFITTVHRGASESGPYVGEFEMGISTIPSTVTMGDCQKTLKEAIRIDNRIMWTWHFKDDLSQHLRWELNNRNTGLFDCFLARDQRPAPPELKVAQFRGAPLNHKGTARTPPTILRINPKGQALFDDILLSVLILAAPTTSSESALPVALARRPAVVELN